MIITGIKCSLVLMLQVLWEMLTREIPFKGMQGVQVAWFVVTKEEVCVKRNISKQSHKPLKFLHQCLIEIIELFFQQNVICMAI